ncbi:hypothetical protein [Synechococcus sp. PROS-9-1]|uniref:hypothetical protein n=1 Tax=Synechococcus sp. PROS-9-1 TaxID=1968775 RepID=UPI0016495E3A|nr:hypothetical protein [Synechococcus sp. PROS-9-1]
MLRLFAGLLPILLAVPVLADDRQYPRHSTAVLGISTEQDENRIIPVFGPKRGMRCGRHSRRCTVSFLNGRMSVDGSIGITPDQIVSITIDPSCCFDTVSYLSFTVDDGGHHLALFWTTHESDLRHFVATVGAFKSGKMNSDGSISIKDSETPEAE